jgi:hypothetical protein
MACIIGAGIAGVCGIIYGIAQYFKKSPEQIADDAEKVFHAAHAESRRFHSEYMNVFMRARYGEPALDDIECNFLERVAYSAQAQGISVSQYIDTMHSFIVTLTKSLEEVKGAIKSLQSCDKTPLYDRLVNLERDIEGELNFIKYDDYNQRFSEHRAYFELFAVESKLYARYAPEIALLQPYADSYQLEKQLLQRAKMCDVYNEYPIVSYYETLRDHIGTLSCCIRDLKYWYPKRSQSAQRFLEDLVYMRNIIADTFAFKEERERKKEDDAYRELLALRKREVEAQEAKAQAERQRALAAQQQARAAQQQACAQQTVVVVQQQVVQQAPSTSQSTATNQNSGTNANAQTITIGQGNNKRTVSVEWYEQNKAGLPNDYTV